MRSGDSGFTLVEVLVALALFSLIGIAGFSLLSAVVGVQSRTDGRLDQLAALQRAMHLMTVDLEQVAAAPLTIENNATTIRRFGAAGGSRPMIVRYDLDDGALRRTLSLGGSAPDQQQRLIPGVAAIKWSFFDKGAWTDAWPPSGRDAAVSLPRAVALEIDLGPQGGGLAGSLRRIVRLPAQPMR